LLAERQFARSLLYGRGAPWFISDTAQRFRIQFVRDVTMKTRTSATMTWPPTTNYSNQAC